MKRSSFLERLRFSYTNALLHDSFRALRSRLRSRRKMQIHAAMVTSRGN